MAMGRGGDRSGRMSKKNFFLAFVEQETKSEWKEERGWGVQQEGKKRRRAKLDE